jgi:hypothetical protein
MRELKMNMIGGWEIAWRVPTWKTREGMKE